MILRLGQNSCQIVRIKSNNQERNPFDDIIESEIQKEQKKVFKGFDNPEEAKITY